MSNPTSTEKFYCGLLNSLDVEIGDKDSTLLYAYEDDGSAGPVRVDGREVVIPTKDNLKKPVEFWNDKVAFHPLTEQALRDDSKVFKTLQYLINWKTVKTLSYLAFNLTQIAAHPEIPKQLNPRQHLLLDALSDANKKTVKFVKEIADASFSGKPGNRLIKTFVKKGGMYQGKKHLAVLITTFSIFEDGNIDEDNRTILGVKAPKIADMEAVPELFKLILPKCHVTNGESYNFGSNDTAAPRLHALLNGYVLLSKRLNEVLELFGEFIEGSDEHKIDLSWISYLAEFGKIKHDVPPLEDNYGEVESSTKSDDQSGKNLSTGDNKNELGTTANQKPSSTIGNVNQKTYYTNPNRNINAGPFDSSIEQGQQNFNHNSSRSKSNMSMNPLMMMQLMNNKGKDKGEKNSMDPMMMMMSMMGGNMDPKQLMMLNMMKDGGEMDMKSMLPLMMANGDSDMSSLLPLLMQGGDIDPMMLMAMSGGKMDPMMMMQLMNGDSDIDPMMLMAMSGGDMDPKQLMMLNMMKDGGEMDMKSMLPLMMAKGDSDMSSLLPLLMQGGDIDPMMLMAMSGGKMDPMMMYLMGSGKKAKKGETTTPKQPKPANKTEYPVDA